MTVNNSADRTYSARLQVRTAVQEALQLWMNEAGYNTVKPMWTRFWTASDAHTAANRALSESNSAVLTAVYELEQAEEEESRSGRALQSDLTVARSRHLTAVAEQTRACQLYAETAARFDEVCAEAAAAASAYFVELSQRAATGVSKAVAAVTACADKR